METAELRRRGQPTQTEKPGVDANGKTVEPHPGGDIKHGGPVELLRLLLMITYLLSSCFSYVPCRWQRKSLTNIESASRNSLGCLSTGTTRTSIMPIWPSRNSPSEYLLRL